MAFFCGLYTLGIDQLLLVSAQLRQVAHRRQAKQTMIFAIKLQRAFVTHAMAHSGCIPFFCK